MMCILCGTFSPLSSQSGQWLTPVNSTPVTRVMAPHFSGSALHCPAVLFSPLPSLMTLSGSVDQDTASLTHLPWLPLSLLLLAEALKEPVRWHQLTVLH